MARQIQRLPGEDAVPEELACLAGACGPYIKPDRAEFHHCARETQEWLIRLDAEEIRNLQFTLKFGFWVRMALKWGKWVAVCFTSGLTFALTLGEKLQKLWSMMEGAISVIRGLF